MSQFGNLFEYFGHIFVCVHKNNINEISIYRHNIFHTTRAIAIIYFMNHSWKSLEAQMIYILYIWENMCIINGDSISFTSTFYILYMMILILNIMTWTQKRFALSSTPFNIHPLIHYWFTMIQRYNQYQFALFVAKILLWNLLKSKIFW